MGKTRKKERNIYDEIRKPVPKSGFAFKSKKRQLEEDALDSELDEYGDVDYKTMKRIMRND